MPNVKEYASVYAPRNENRLVTSANVNVWGILIVPLVVVVVVDVKALCIAINV